MSSFVANGTATDTGTIESGGWWPAIEPDRIRQSMRLDGVVTPERLRAALVIAVVTVNDDLADWQQQHLANGVVALADVPAAQIDGRSRYVVLYERAVATYAAAEVTERYRSYDATNTANQRADDLTPSIDELRRDHRWALRDFRGQRRMTVELL